MNWWEVGLLVGKPRGKCLECFVRILFGNMLKKKALANDQKSIRSDAKNIFYCNKWEDISRLLGHEKNVNLHEFLLDLQGN